MAVEEGPLGTGGVLPGYLCLLFTTCDDWGRWYLRMDITGWGLYWSMLFYWSCGLFRVRGLYGLGLRIFCEFWRFYIPPEIPTSPHTSPSLNLSLCYLRRVPGFVRKCGAGGWKFWPGSLRSLVIVEYEYWITKNKKNSNKFPRGAGVCGAVVGVTHMSASNGVTWNSFGKIVDHYLYTEYLIYNGGPP